MAISITRYVDITSGVGGVSQVARREFIARFFSTNPLIPTGSYIELDTLDDVGVYFGTTSDEYKRAAFYFGFLSKNITRPRKISFARWVDVAVGARIFGASAETDLTLYQAITAGEFTITLGGTPGAVTGVNLSAVGSLADVASTIQAAVNLLGAPFDLATVSFNASAGRFEFDSGNTGNETIAVQDDTDNILELMGWTQATAILSDGSDAETVTDTLIASADASNNFGSFEFIPALTEAQHVEAATWNQALNILFMYMVRTSATDAASLSAALIDIGGTLITLHDESLEEYPQVLPMAVLAATNYDARASVQNYMYQQASGLSALVKTNTNANVYDPLRVNYYGETQTAGNKISFYQRGIMCGGSTFPISANVYANEIWFKDFQTTQMLNLLLSKGRVSANDEGRGEILVSLQEGIEAALLNGTISVGKELDSVQKVFIAEQTGDPLAYIQIQNAGYWIDVQFESEVVGGVTEYKAVYTILYAKDDVVRSVEGRHILI